MGYPNRAYKEQHRVDELQVYNNGAVVEIQCNICNTAHLVANSPTQAPPAEKATESICKAKMEGQHARVDSATYKETQSVKYEHTEIAGNYSHMMRPKKSLKKSGPLHRP